MIVRDATNKLLSVVILLSVSHWAVAGKTHVLGANSCFVWALVFDRAAGSPQVADQSWEWMAGYLTGLSLALDNGTSLKDVDEDSLKKRSYSFCKGNLHLSTTDAGAVLYDEIRRGMHKKKKGSLQ